MLIIYLLNYFIIVNFYTKSSNQKENFYFLIIQYLNFNSIKNHIFYYILNSNL
jgi:hypothetical protein